jgi:hypothetical protein
MSPVEPLREGGDHSSEPLLTAFRTISSTASAFKPCLRSRITEGAVAQKPQRIVKVGVKHHHRGILSNRPYEDLLVGSSRPSDLTHVSTVIAEFA